MLTLGRASVLVNSDMPMRLADSANIWLRADNGCAGVGERAALWFKGVAWCSGNTPIVVLLFGSAELNQNG